MAEEKSKRAERVKRVKRRRIQFAVMAGIIIVGIIAVSLTATWWIQKTEHEGEELIVYCGAGMREPMDAIGEEFYENFGVNVQYTYGGSNTLLSQIKLLQKGDVYMPGSLSYIQSAAAEGYIGKNNTIAYHIEVIATPEGNPGNVKTLEDLAIAGRNDILFGDPQAAAFGKLGKKILEKNGLWDEVEPNIISYAATVNEAVLWLAQEQGSASIVWKSSLIGLEDKTDYFIIPEEQNIIQTIPIGTLTFSNRTQLAEKFIDFVAVRGKQIFEEKGFEAYYEGQELDLSFDVEGPLNNDLVLSQGTISVLFSKW